MHWNFSLLKTFVSEWEWLFFFSIWWVCFFERTVKNKGYFQPDTKTEPPKKRHLVTQFSSPFKVLLSPSKSLSLTGAILRAQHLQKTINISHTSTQNPQHTPHPHHTGLNESIHTQNTLWPINNTPWGVSGQITANKLLTLFAAAVKSC